jgi:NAD(P)-dependent dehydrogenase (short-subunit alcohol dehydrogenase family)
MQIRVDPTSQVRKRAMEARNAIFITGAGSGIGQAVARLFAAQGWHVGLAGTNTARLDTTRAGLPDGLSSTHSMDVLSREGWTAALERFTGITGRLDVLFNNAGIAVGGPFAETSFDDLDRVIAVNFTGVVNGARCGHAFLKATPGSCLLNTASAAAIWGAPGAAVYSATKFAVRGLTEALDAEWAADGIRVRSLMPGYIETPMLDGHPVGSTQSFREIVQAQGLAITPVEAVAEAAWAAVHGDALHTVVGKTAKQIGFAARWMPGRLRRQMRGPGAAMK